MKKYQKRAKKLLADLGEGWGIIPTEDTVEFIRKELLIVDLSAKAEVYEKQLKEQKEKAK